MIKNTLVKIHKCKEFNRYLVYFSEVRKLATVNYIGSEIIDSFFNRQYPINKIAKKHNVSKGDIINFLQELRNELILRPRGNIQMYQTTMDIPTSVEIEITRQCNLRCKHCCIQKYDKLMSINKIEYILKTLNKKGVFEIALGGGEPFFHPNILNILSLCKQYDFIPIITTNATLLNKSLIKKIAKFKNIALVISLEGFGEINDMIRGRGVFKKVDRAIRRLKENNIYVEITATITKKNINHYREFIKYSKSLDIPCNFLLFKPFKESHKNYVLKPNEYFKFVEELFKEKKYGTKVNLPNAESIFAYLDGQKKCNECHAVMCSFIIDAEGNMVPCFPLQAAGYYDKIKLPKFNENFINIWKNNQYFQELRKGNLLECQARSYIFNKNIKGKDPYGINAFRKYQKTKN